MANDWELDEMENENSSTIKSIRDHAKNLERQLKAQERELETLRKMRDQYEADARRAKAQAAFAEVGLSEKHATLFAALNPDAEPDVEAVKAFAEEYGLAPAPASTDGDDKVVSHEDPGFSPVASGTPTDKRRYSSEEWWALQRENPAAALLAVKENRVDLANSFADLEKG